MGSVLNLSTGWQLSQLYILRCCQWDMLTEIGEKCSGIRTADEIALVLKVNQGLFFTKDYTACLISRTGLDVANPYHAYSRKIMAVRRFGRLYPDLNQQRLNTCKLWIRFNCISRSSCDSMIRGVRIWLEKCLQFDHSPEET